MLNRPAVVIRRLAITVVLLLAAGTAAVMLLRADPSGQRGSGLPAGFRFDLRGQMTIDAALIQFAQTAKFPVPGARARALAVGPDDRIYVAGDHVVQVLRADGRPTMTVRVSGQPTCLAVAGPKHVVPHRIYVGAGGQIELFSADGRAAGVWQGPDGKSLFTAIAPAARCVFVADAGLRMVLRYNDQGKIVQRIGRPDPNRQMPGFVIPSPYFDVAVGHDGDLYAVNPGARRVEIYSPDGALEGFWGKASSAIDGFFGCCNPAHLALLPDGRFVTSEKGIPRIKVYRDTGDFECVVAGPRQLGITAAALGDPRTGQGPRVFDIATDRQGRVLVLDPVARIIRVFVRNKSARPARDLSLWDGSNEADAGRCAEPNLL